MTNSVIYTISIVTISFMSMLFSNSVIAENNIPSRGPIPFSVYDQDRNGMISKQEFDTIRGERIKQKQSSGMMMRSMINGPSFSDFDTNNDNQLSETELLSGQKSQREKRRNLKMGQGRGINKPIFDDYDLNGDGKITEQEFNKAKSFRIKNRIEQGYKMKNLKNTIPFSTIDLNKDGKITKEEFLHHQTNSFKAKQSLGSSQLSANNISNDTDSRVLVEMPEQAKNLMRKDMQVNLTTLNSIISSLASGDFELASNIAEKMMGKSVMGKHRGTGAAPGRFMLPEMRNIGWAMHDSASKFADVAREKDINKALRALEKVTSSCVACHNAYRIR